MTGKRTAPVMQNHNALESFHRFTAFRACSDFWSLLTKLIFVCSSSPVSSHLKYHKLPVITNLLSLWPMGHGKSAHGLSANHSTWRWVKTWCISLVLERGSANPSKQSNLFHALQSVPLKIERETAGAQNNQAPQNISFESSGREVKMWNKWKRGWASWLAVRSGKLLLKIYSTNTIADVFSDNGRLHSPQMPKIQNLRPVR